MRVDTEKTEHESRDISESLAFFGVCRQSKTTCDFEWNFFHTLFIRCKGSDWDDGGTKTWSYGESWLPLLKTVNINSTSRHPRTIKRNNTRSMVLVFQLFTPAEFERFWLRP